MQTSDGDSNRFTASYQIVLLPECRVSVKLVAQVSPCWEWEIESIREVAVVLDFYEIEIDRIPLTEEIDDVQDVVEPLIFRLVDDENGDADQRNQ